MLIFSKNQKKTNRRKSQKRKKGLKGKKIDVPVLQTAIKVLPYVEKFSNFNKKLKKKQKSNQNKKDVEIL